MDNATWIEHIKTHLYLFKGGHPHTALERPYLSARRYAERKNNELKDEPEFAGLREKHLKFQDLLVQKNLELQQDAKFKKLRKAEEKSRWIFQDFSMEFLNEFS